MLSTLITSIVESDFAVNKRQLQLPITLSSLQRSLWLRSGNSLLWDAWSNLGKLMTLETKAPQFLFLKFCVFSVFEWNVSFQCNPQCSNILNSIWTLLLTKIPVDLVSSSPWELLPLQVFRLLGLIPREIELSPGGSNPREHNKALVIAFGTQTEALLVLRFVEVVVGFAKKVTSAFSSLPRVNRKMIISGPCT